MTDTQQNAKELQEQRAWNWQWPGSGEEDDPLPRNCWNTGLPPTHKPHANAHKRNFTPLPGSACKRAKKRQRAANQRTA